MFSKFCLLLALTTGFVTVSVQSMEKNANDLPQILSSLKEESLTDLKKRNDMQEILNKIKADEEGHWQGLLLYEKMLICAKLELGDFKEESKALLDSIKESEGAPQFIDDINVFLNKLNEYESVKLDGKEEDVKKIAEGWRDEIIDNAFSFLTNKISVQSEQEKVEESILILPVASCLKVLNTLKDDSPLLKDNKFKGALRQILNKLRDSKKYKEGDKDLLKKDGLMVALKVAGAGHVRDAGEFLQTLITAKMLKREEDCLQNNSLLENPEILKQWKAQLHD